MSNLDALIPLFGGIYGFLLATGVLPRNPKDAERMESWRNNFGGIMTFICPILVLYGIAKLLGVLG